MFKSDKNRVSRRDKEVWRMFCPNCGKENLEGSGFCESCGYPLSSNPTTFNNNAVNNMNANVNNPQSGKGKTNVCAIVGFILSLVGFLCFGMLFEPAAIILGIVAKIQIKKNPEQSGSGLALAAIIIGSIGTVFSIIGIIINIFYAVNALDDVFLDAVL